MAELLNPLMLFGFKQQRDMYELHINQKSNIPVCRNNSVTIPHLVKMNLFEKYSYARIIIIIDSHRHLPRHGKNS